MTARLERAFAEASKLPDQAQDEVASIVLQALQDQQPPPASSHKPIWEVVEELRKSVPPEEFSKLPEDGAEQLDHYIYGTPKRPRA